MLIMSKIKYNESNLEYSVKLKNINDRIICEFDAIDDAKSAPLSEGFYELNEHNDIIQGDYSDYKYVYKKESDLIFILTKDKNDVYTEPEDNRDSTTEILNRELTEEEKEEMERQSKILNIKYQIESLKSQLNDTDYIFIKCYEASLVGEEINEYDLESIHNTRQSLREQINSLEAELQNL